ncbi:MAG TPA: hypothetical protein VFH56_07220 [Acidimicrobiales bacterium]|nr:hypothetical protein [Acidimicrobiales bacterium]
MSVATRPPPLLQEPPPPARRRGRRWPWIAAAAVVAVVATVAALFWFGGDAAKQVSMDKARSRLPSGQTGPLGQRPAPGVYQYTGSGTDRLTLPPESQPQGPSMPGTVTLQGADCWAFRIDYSTHHWQTWNFCWRGGEMQQTGGQLWQLWPVGPMSVTNSTSVTCTPAVPILRARPIPGETWNGHCSATSSAVKGTMQATSVYRYLGRTELKVNGVGVPAEHLSIAQTDQGSQKGTETYQMWVQPGSGLLLRLDHDIKVSTATPFGTSTYTETGTFSLASLTPQQG